MNQPTRTCIACRKPQLKKDLIRVVHSADNNIMLDFTGRANGRGAYLCDNIACMEKAVKKKLFNREFKVNIDAAVYEKLAEEYRARK